MLCYNYVGGDNMTDMELFTKKITLYHGNKDKHMIPQFGKGRSNNDYGRGFYCTRNIELACEWAYSQYTVGDQGYLHTYECKLDGLKVFDLTTVDSLHWIAELLYNRTIDYDDYSDSDHILRDRVSKFLDKYKLDLTSYDIIIGYRADDSYFSYIKRFVSGNMYKSSIEAAMHLGTLGKQYFLQSEEAFKSLQKVSVCEVSKEYTVKYNKRDLQARSDLRYIIANNNNNNVERKTIIDFL